MRMLESLTRWRACSVPDVTDPGKCEASQRGQAAINGTLRSQSRDQLLTEEHHVVRYLDTTNSINHRHRVTPSSSPAAPRDGSACKTHTSQPDELLFGMTTVEHPAEDGEHIVGPY
jgi:hypothetical protein